MINAFEDEFVVDDVANHRKLVECPTMLDHVHHRNPISRPNS